MQVNETSLLILAGILAALIVALAVVRARTGSFSLSWRNVKATLDMRSGQPQEASGKPATASTGGTGNISNVEIGRGATVSGAFNAQVGHTTNITGGDRPARDPVGEPKDASGS